MKSAEDYLRPASECEMAKLASREQRQITGVREAADEPRSALSFRPSHWRARAESARALARHLTDPRAVEAMLRVAHEYDELARQAASRILMGSRLAQD